MAVDIGNGGGERGFVDRDIRWEMGNDGETVRPLKITVCACWLVPL